MRYIRAFIRGILLVLYLIWHVSLLMLRPLLFGFNMPFALRVRGQWARRSLHMLGVRVEVELPAPVGKYIYVGNHRSYLDPIIVMLDVDTLPVAKAEVRSWPLIGYGAKMSGVMFVKRESKVSRAATLEAMGEVLRAGWSVLVYPEGTTHTQAETMPFRAGAFRLAEQEQVAVVPMAIEYLHLSDAWVGKDTFIPHFLRCFGKKRTRVKIRYGAPIPPGDPDEVIAGCRAWIDEQVRQMRRAFAEETDRGSG